MDISSREFSIMLQPLLILIIISLIMYIVIRIQMHRGLAASPQANRSAGIAQAGESVQGRESFTSGREKAEAVASWFASAASPTYVNFRAEVNKGSDHVDIVDYYRASRASDKSAGGLEAVL
jgi:hypothetical protein